MSVPYEPHPYQLRCIRWGVGRGAAGFLLSPGLGKTSIMYAIFQVLREKGLAERMLVLAPLRTATSTWPREQQKWSDFADLSVHVLHGRDRQRLLEQPHDVSVINSDQASMAWLLGYEADEPMVDRAGRPVLSSQGQPRYRRVRQPGAAEQAGVSWDILVVDESTRFKYTTTERFRLLRPHLPRFARRYILTGEPAPNGLLDLFGQAYILDLGHALGGYITRYRQQYFNSTGYGGYTWVPKEDAEERIYQALRPLVIRLDEQDHLQMPPLVGTGWFRGDSQDVREVELPPRAMRQYRQMETILMTQVEGGLVTAANAASATMKCRQIANGGIYTQPPKYQLLHDAKTEMVQELVEELSGRPAVVTYEFRHDLARLQRAFPRAPHYGGGITTQEATRLEDRWNGGDIPLLLVQPQSAAHGLNLQGVGATVIFGSLFWDLEVTNQFIRRFWRQGQRERVSVIFPAARGTVDLAVLRALRSKDRAQRRLLDALRGYLRER